MRRAAPLPAYSRQRTLTCPEAVGRSLCATRPAGSVASQLRLLAVKEHQWKLKSLSGHHIPANAVRAHGQQNTHVAHLQAGTGQALNGASMQWAGFQPLMVLKEPPLARGPQGQDPSGLIQKAPGSGAENQSDAYCHDGTLPGCNATNNARVLQEWGTSHAAKGSPSVIKLRARALRCPGAPTKSNLWCLGAPTQKLSI